VEEPFRVRKAARRKGVGRGGEGAVPVGAAKGRVGGKGGGEVPLEEDEELERLFAAEAASSSRQNVSNPAAAAVGQRGAAQSGGRPSVSTPSRDPAQGRSQTPATSSRGDEQLSDGIAAALARLREKG
jgi:DNA excision repair protein ERCC-1